MDRTPNGLSSRAERELEGSRAHPLPSLGEAFAVWLRIGLLSFGGPAAQIALMHREVVEAKGWLSEREYLNALSFCMLLPGPEAMQIATYAGWRLHGTAGGLIAGLLFVIPGACVIAAMATIYALFGDLPLINALFLGIKSAVIVIVIEALLRVAKRALTGRDNWSLAALAFVGIFFFSVPFPLIIGLAALYGLARSQTVATDDASLGKAGPASASGLIGRIAIWGALWWAPIVLLAYLQAPLLTDIGVFFSKLAVVTFGGAYAVLAYLAQDVVNHYGWLSAGQMMDGLGLAETTPGPLILVTEFVGFMAGYQEGGLALAFGAAALTLWVTFVPCFLWIFAGAPYLDWIASQPRLRGALAAITAAVVGVMLNLSIWFALHVFFQTVSKASFGPVTVWLPDVSSLDWRVALLALVCGVLLLRRQWSVGRVLAIAGLGGLILAQV